MASLSSTWVNLKSPVLNEVIGLVQGEMDLVENLLQTNLIDDNPFVTELLAKIFSAGGKRLRPLLTLLASRATLDKSMNFSRTHIILAALSELIHTASLVHDDVLDNSSLRRGKATLNNSNSDKLAVLMGDLLFAQASVCLARLMNPEVVGIYGQVLGDLCAGEIKQMSYAFNLDINLESYILKSISKTATLFSACAHSGAVLNQTSNSVILGMKSYGLELGICFQIVDDLLDVVGVVSELGKPAGSDLQNGVITAPAIFVLQRDDVIAAKLRHLIESRAVQNPSGLDQALSLIRKYGGVEQTELLARQYATKSLQTLTNIKNSIYKDGLEAIISLVLERVA